MSKIVHFMDPKRQRFLERFPPKMRFIAANAVLQVVRENRDTSDPQELLAILKLLLFVRLDWVDVMKLEPESWTLWKRPGEQAAFIMLRMIFEEPEMDGTYSGHGGTENVCRIGIMGMRIP